MLSEMLNCSVDAQKTYIMALQRDYVWRRDNAYWDAGCTTFADRVRTLLELEVMCEIDLRRRHYELSGK
jgi:hypothetical protein